MRLLHPTICILVVGLVTGCSDSTPSSADAKDALQAALGGLTVGSTDCKFFSDRAQEGSGRASCAGTVTLNDDLYSEAPSTYNKAQLEAAGIPSAGTDFFIRRHPIRVYTRSASAGTSIEFSAECIYQGQAKGWALNCSPQYQRPDGNLLSDLGDNVTLSDSDQYRAYVASVVNDYRQMDAAFETIKSAINGFFKPGALVSAYERFADGNRHILDARIQTAMDWGGEVGFLGKPAEFGMQIRSTHLTDTYSNRTFCGWGRGLPKEDIKFGGQIYFDSREQQFKAWLEMLDRTSDGGGNSYGSCGQRLRWEAPRWNMHEKQLISTSQ